MSDKKDSVGRTILVALAVSLVCSIVVSVAAVKLRPVQEFNEALDRKENILMAAGLYNKERGGNVGAIFDEKVRARLIDLKSGAYVNQDPGQYDQYKVAKDPSRAIVLAENEDIAGIRTLAPYSVVYEVYSDSKLDLVVLPVHGKGLWSTLYGYIAVRADTNTVEGLGFYSHKETPGLGGEVDNPSWKDLWKGKQLRDAAGELRIEVVKGAVNMSKPRAAYQVDGLSGATITSRGGEPSDPLLDGKTWFCSLSDKIKIAGGASWLKKRKIFS